MVSLNPEDLGWDVIGRYFNAEDADSVRRLVALTHPNWEVRVVKRTDQLDKQFVVQWRYYARHAE